MFSERLLMKVFTFNPQLEVTLFRRRLQVKSKTVFDIAVYLVTIFSSIQIAFMYGFNDISNFLSVLQQVLYIITAAVNILAHFDLNKTYDKLVKIEVPVNSFSAESERVILSLVLLKLWMILSSVVLVVSIKPEFKVVVISLAFALGNFSVLEASVLKHLVADRLKRVTRMESVDRIVSTTRRVLDCNCQLNTHCSPTTTVVNVTIIYHFMTYWYQMWKLFRANKADDAGSTWEVQRPLLMTLTLASFYFNVLIFSHFSSEVSDSVEEVNMELDKIMTMKRCSEKEDKFISLFLLELYHTPVTLSALGFFTICRSTLTTALGAMTSYLMVIIQFS